MASGCVSGSDGWGGIRPVSPTPNLHLSHFFPLQRFPLGPLEEGGHTPQSQPPPVQPRGPPRRFADQGPGAQSLTNSKGHPYLAAGGLGSGRGQGAVLSAGLSAPGLGPARTGGGRGGWEGGGVRLQGSTPWMLIQILRVKPGG